MKNLIIVTLVFLLGCKQSTKNTSSTSNKNEQYLQLLTKFKDITFDTLEVYPLIDGTKIEAYKYYGVELDSADATLFPGNIATAHFNDPPSLFACYKFNIDSSRVGLIARTPSVYYPTSIKLFVYTTNKDTLIEITELAEYLGDAGDLLDVNSWLIKDGNTNIQVLKWVQESIDNSLENDKTTNIAIRDHLLLYNVSTNKSDTLSNNIANLPAGFSKLIRRKQDTKKTSE